MRQPFTALFGGTFDPPHSGHRQAIEGLFENPGVERVIVLPSAQPPLKTARAETHHRVEMAKLAFGGLANVEIDARETLRKGPSYTFDTLWELNQEGVKNLAFVIGTDQLEKLPLWHRFPETLGLCHWFILERKPDSTEQTRRGLQPLLASGLLKPKAPALWQITSASGGERMLQIIPTQAPALSASSIREAIGKTGTPPAQSLSKEVEYYLKRHRIYGTSKAGVVLT